jgi:hypothetical protein
MDPANVVVAILIGAAALLLLWMISQRHANHASQEFLTYSPSEELDPNQNKSDSMPTIGSEIPLPPGIQEFTGVGGDSGRPTLTNYYFAATDLKAGPPDPRQFFDDFSAVFLNPDDGHNWTAQYTIATPSGLQKFMEENHYEYVYGSDMIFVKRYDLAAILKAVIERELAAFSDPDQEQPELDT